MKVHEPETKKSLHPSFTIGDRVEHVSLGGGFIRDVTRTGGGNWSIYVEFDEYQERIKGRYAPIVPEYKGKVYLTKVDDPYEDVEFGTNVLDLDVAITGSTAS